MTQKQHMTPRLPHDAVRATAMHILLRVETDAAYANILLEEAMREMPPRDAGFCTMLTLGVLRRRGQLDWVLDRLLRQPIASALPTTRQILRLGAFQILHTDVRKAAAVDESVKLAKAFVGLGASKLVNAILRKVDRENAFAGLARVGTKDWAIATGLPRWYVDAARSVFPEEKAFDACLAACNEAALTVRTNTARTTSAALTQALAETGIGATPHPIVPDLLTVYAPAPVLIRSDPFREGWCHVQDGSAVLAALALEAQPGERIADLCAAPGGKTGILASQVGAHGSVVAVERDPRRASLVDALVAREGHANVTVLIADAAQPHAALQPGSFDRVLVDAPCSGTGIARHRPDMLWHPAPQVEQSLVPIQRALLAAGIALLKPGGVLIYSVCSFLPAEGLAAVSAATADAPRITADPLPALLGRWTHEPEHAIIPPGDGGLDGFTVVRLRCTS